MAIESGAYQTSVSTTTDGETAVTTTASIASGGFSSASNATINNMANGSDKYPITGIKFKGTMSAAPSAGDSISIYQRMKNIFGGADSENTPNANNKSGYLGSIALDPSQTGQTFVLRGAPIEPGDFELYFEVNTSSVSLNSGAEVTIQRQSGVAAP